MARQPLGLLARWLPLALVAVTWHAAADNYTLSLQPAWGGYVKPGVPSELGLSLLAPRGGRARLTVRGSRTLVSGEGVFEAGLPLQLHLPLAHDTALPVTVELAIDGRPVHSDEQQLHVLPASATVVAVADPGGSGAWPPQAMLPAAATVVHVSAAELPHTGQAYRFLSALFLAESVLPAMTGTQRRALAEYTAGCGVLYLSGFSTPQAQALRATAGCGARNLAVPSPASTAIALPAAGASSSIGAVLKTLAPASPDTLLRSIVVFLGGYIIVLLLGARSAKSAAALLILPPAATALAWVAWSQASPRIEVASLAEMDSGDPMARFASLLQVTGTAPREIVLALPAQLGLPAPQEREEPVEIELDPAGQRLDLRLGTHLMSRHALLVEGIARGSLLAVASTASDVLISNRGAARSAPAILAWRGQRYSVPALAAGEAWRQPPAAEAWGRTAPERLLRERATDGGCWLLVPHDIPALRSLASDGVPASWLLIRGTGDA